MKKSKVKAEAKTTVPKPAPVVWEVNKDHIRLLVEALRSGKYPQGKGSLRSGSCLCAAGVACDVYRKVEGQSQWTSWSLNNIENVTWGFIAPSGMIYVAGLPYELSLWYGVRNFDQDLIHWNDGEGLTFAEIADRLEAKYELKEDV